jgi:hypothetical protein
MFSRVRPLSIVLAAVLGMAALPSLAAGDEITDLVRQSGFIFRGTVLDMGRATMTGVPVDAGTAIVAVQEVLHTPPGLDDFTGRTITVELREPGRPGIGEPAAFFTRTWIFGASLMVREVGALPLGTSGVDEKWLTGRVAEAAREVADEGLRSRLGSATWVVAGTVVSIAPARVPARIAPEVTEHEPDWWIAQVKVQSVVKGTGWPGELAVLFPHSDDVAYHRNPKLSPGQERIFILHDDAIRVRNRGLAGLTALDPLDVQGVEQLSRVQGLVIGGGR